jgi:hypothetical protein
MPTFWAGIEQILNISGGGRPAFLLGRFSSEGFPTYFPVAFLAKTPLPILLLLPIAAFFLVKDKTTRGQALFLLLPAVIYFLLSTQSSLNIGYRHLLPVLPFILVLISGFASLRVCEFASGQVGGLASGRIGEFASRRAANGKSRTIRITFYVLRFTPNLNSRDCCCEFARNRCPHPPALFELFQRGRGRAGEWAHRFD